MFVVSEIQITSSVELVVETGVLYSTSHSSSMVVDARMGVSVGIGAAMEVVAFGGLDLS